MPLAEFKSFVRAAVTPVGFALAHRIRKRQFNLKCSESWGHPETGMTAPWQFSYGSRPLPAHLWDRACIQSSLAYVLRLSTVGRGVAATGSREAPEAIELRLQE